MSQREQLSDHFKRLDETSRNWFQFIQDFSDNGIERNFDHLCKTIEENNILLKTIEDNHKRQLNEIIANCGLDVCNKTAEELTEADLTNEANVLSSAIESMGCELSDKKQLKSELSEKTKALTKQLEQMESTTKQLKRQNESKNNEYLTLASVMRVMYKTWTNSQVVGRKLLGTNQNSIV